MDEGRRIGEVIPPEERVSFLNRTFLPSGVTHIGAGTFYYCESLEEVVMPCDLDFSGSRVFEEARSLKRIFIRKELRD